MSLPAIVSLFSRRQLVSLDDDFASETYADVGYVDVERAKVNSAIERLEMEIQADTLEMQRIQDRRRQRSYILAGEKAKAKVLAQFGAAQPASEQGAQQIAAE